MIYGATALAQWLAPSDELGGRLLVFLASTSAVVLLFLLLCELGLAPLFGAASVCIGLSVPMFLTYGTMLDTLMLGLPFAVGYLLLWQRSLNGRANHLALGCAAVTVCLVAWEGVILVAATMLVMVVARRDRDRWRVIAAAAIGAAAAVLVTWLWQLWVYGGLAKVLDKGAFRAQGSGFSVGGYLHRQLAFAREAFGIPGVVVLAIGVVALVASRHFRPVAVATLGTSIVYAVAFREGSFVHQYWNYWVVIALVLAIGAIASILSRIRHRALLIVPCLAATAFVVFGFHAELGEARQRNLDDRQAKREPALTHPARGQRWVPFVGDFRGVGRLGDTAEQISPGTTAAWVLPQARFYFRVPLRFTTPREASSYGRRHPDAWIVLDYDGVGGGELVRGRAAVARLRLDE